MLCEQNDMSPTMLCL